MNRCALLLASGWLTVLGGYAAARDADGENGTVAAAVKKAGGRVEVDPNAPGQPVVKVFFFSPQVRDDDLALYSAKAAGKDRYALFEASMYEGVTGRLELEADMSSALQDGQFFLLYQPIFELSGREVVGVEALIRWQHPTRGVLSPDSFIPLAEESGLIVAIGRWVLYEACRQAAAWAAAGRAIGVAV